MKLQTSGFWTCLAILLGSMSSAASSQSTVIEAHALLAKADSVLRHTHDIDSPFAETINRVLARQIEQLVFDPNAHVSESEKNELTQRWRQLQWFPDFGTASKGASGSISGRIVDSQGLPVSGASLRLFEDGSLVTFALDQADNGGRFSLDSLPPGDYRLSATVSGGVAAVYPGVSCYGGVGTGCSILDGDIISVAANQHQKHLLFQVASGGRISGQITDEITGEPLRAFIQVDAIGNPAHSQIVFSSLDGHYVITGLPPGTYELSAYDSSYKRQYFGSAQPCDIRSGDQNCAGSPLDIAPNEILENVDFDLAAFGRLGGSVSSDDPNAAELRGEIEIFNPQDGTIIYRFDLVNSHWQSPPIPDMPISLHVLADQHLPFVYPNQVCPGLPSSCQQTQGQPITAMLNTVQDNLNSVAPRGSTISGSVSLPSSVGRPDFGRSPISVLNVNGQLFGKIEVDRFGGYLVGGLREGQYFVTVELLGEEYRGQIYPNINCGRGQPSCTSYSGHLVDPQLINLGSDSHIEDINFNINQTAFLTGKVTSPDGVTGIQRSPVLVYNDAGEVVRQSEADTDGVYRIPVPSGGPFYVGTFGSEPVVSTFYPDLACAMAEACDPTQGAELYFPPEGEILINLIRRFPGRVSGTVSSATGPEDIQVELLNLDGQVVARSVPWFFDQYAISGILPGAYFLRTASTALPNQLYPDVPCGSANCPPDNAVPLQIGLDQWVTEVDFLLTDRSGISLTIDSRVDRSLLRSYNVSVYRSNATLLTSLEVSGTVGIALEPGQYFLVAQPTSQDDIHLGRAFGGADCEENCLTAGATLITVTEGKMTPVRFELNPERGVFGSVTDAVTGAGIGGIGASVYLDGAQGRFRGRTDPDGQFGIWAPPGEYRLWAEKDGYFSQAYPQIPCNPCNGQQGQLVDIRAFGALENINFPLTPYPDISGQVQIAGQPLAYATLTLRTSPADAFYQSARADANGFYRFSQVPPGQYRLRATGSGAQGEIWPDYLCEPFCDWQDAPQFNVASSPLTNVNLDLRPFNYVSLRGRIINSFTGKTVPDVSIIATRDDGISFGTLSQTDGFLLFGIVPGRYQLQFQSIYFFDEYYLDIDCERDPTLDCSDGSGPLIEIGPGPLNDIGSVTLDPKTAIFVNLSDNSTGQPAFLSGVSLYDLEGNLVRPRLSETQQFDVIEPGSYRIFVDGFRNPFYPLVYPDIRCLGGLSDGCSLNDGGIITVESGEQRLIDIGLDRLPTLKVRGRDRYGNGNTFSLRQILLRDLGGIDAMPPDSSTHGVAAGQYRIIGLSNGYQTTAWPGAPCLNLECNSAGAVPVVINDGDNLDLIIDMTRTNGISGRVIDGETLQALAGVTVDVWDQQEQLITTAASNPEGTFSVGLRDGDYRVSTDNGLGYLDLIFPDIECRAGSAFAGRCSLSRGLALTVDSTSSAPPFVEFFLGPDDTVFVSGFEQ